jgi:hypothetical protein
MNEATGAVQDCLEPYRIELREHDMPIVVALVSIQARPP